MTSTTGARHHRRRPPLTAAIVAATLFVALPPTAVAQPPRRIAPQADAIMKTMSAFLAKTVRFTLEAEESFDEIREGAPRAQVSNVRRMVVERPSHFATDATGDTLNRSAWYDGRTLSALDTRRNVYVTVDMPSTIDGVLDRIAADYWIVIPLSDLLYADPYATLMEDAQSGEYLGLHQVGGVACHHLAFSQEDLQWQIWIDAGDQPLPRKLVITYVLAPGAPQYVATIRRWTLEPAATPELFRFTPPAGARKIDPAEFLGFVAASKAVR